MTDATTVGERVLAGFAKGRAKAIEVQRATGAATLRAVRRAIDDDVLAGHGERNRVKRIALKLRMGEKRVRRAMDRLKGPSVEA